MCGHFTKLCMKGLILEAKFGEDPSLSLMRMRCGLVIRYFFQLLISRTRSLDEGMFFFLT